MNKKIIALLSAIFVVTLTSLGFASPASATGDKDKPADSKKITLCHATGSASNPYTKITVSVSAFYNAGHIDHEGDIWEAFSYVTKGGDTVHVPARGNTALLAFDDCVEPKVDEKIYAPDYTFRDPCGTENDALIVPPGRGYTVGDVVTAGLVKTVIVTANEGFVFKNGLKTVTFSHTFTNVDCGLPETGGKEIALAGGLAALGMLALAGVALRRMRQTS